jgi:hypothetical protein
VGIIYLPDFFLKMHRLRFIKLLFYMLFCIGLKLGLLLLWKMIENVENKNILEKIHEDVSYALLSTMP